MIPYLTCWSLVGGKNSYKSLSCRPEPPDVPYKSRGFLNSKIPVTTESALIFAATNLYKSKRPATCRFLQTTRHHTILCFATATITCNHCNGVEHGKLPWLKQRWPSTQIHVYEDKDCVGGGAHQKNTLTHSHVAVRCTPAPPPRFLVPHAFIPPHSNLACQTSNKHMNRWTTGPD